MHAVQDDGDIQPQTEVKILDVIKRIRSKDPSIYDSSKKFFEAKDGEGGSEEDVEEDGMKEKKKAKKVKPVYLKDVIAQQALARAEAGGEGDSSDDDSDVEKRKVRWSWLLRCGRSTGVVESCSSRGGACLFKGIAFVEECHVDGRVGRHMWRNKRR
jgi:hypothetical protein